MKHNKTKNETNQNLIQFQKRKKKKKSCTWLPFISKITL